jgi:hypothetical protein
MTLLEDLKVQALAGHPMAISVARMYVKTFGGDWDACMVDVHIHAASDVYSSGPWMRALDVLAWLKKTGRVKT